VFRKLLSLEDARRLVFDQARRRDLGIEEILLGEATGAVLAEDIVAPMDIPPFDRSTVDGYAVRAEDTFGAEENRPILLKIVGAVPIGELPIVKVGRKEAVGIVTGAPVPKGADAVVMVEDTEKLSDCVRVFAAVPKYGNMMRAGGDIRKGEIVLGLGRVLGSREIGVMAALGMNVVRVRRVPRIAVFSTGPEIEGLGEDLPPGKIYDINMYSLSSAILESGAKPVRLGVIQDNLSDLQEALTRGLDVADMVVTSGGVSVGPKDVMPKALASLEKSNVVFSGISVKPGKPTTVAVVDGRLVFALPGHPTSALLVFYLLVRPAIQALAGRGPEEGLEVEALAETRMFSAKGRRTFVMVTLKREEDHRILAQPVSKGDSGAITTLARADGFVEIPENVQFVDVGEKVAVHLFGSKIWRF
jgi:putative molybdopterin biosynthesis protein